MAQMQPISVEILRNQYYQDNWVWDSSAKGEHVMLSSDLRAAYFYTDPLLETTGTAGVHGTKGFLSGEHYWEIMFLEPPSGMSVMVGVGTKEAVISLDNYTFVDLIGCVEKSWELSYKGNIWHKGQAIRYCEPFYEQNTVIGVHLNLYAGTITFYRDGKSLGVAFKDIDTYNKQFYPMSRSTSANTELEVGAQTCCYTKLHEKCHLLAQCVHSIEDIQALPLPSLLKRHISSIRRVS